MPCLVTGYSLTILARTAAYKTRSSYMMTTQTLSFVSNDVLPANTVATQAETCIVPGCCCGARGHGYHESQRRGAGILGISLGPQRTRVRTLEAIDCCLAVSSSRGPIKKTRRQGPLPRPPRVLSHALIGPSAKAVWRQANAGHVRRMTTDSGMPPLSTRFSCGPSERTAGPSRNACSATCSACPTTMACLVTLACLPCLRKHGGIIARSRGAFRRAQRLSRVVLTKGQ